MLKCGPLTNNYLENSKFEVLELAKKKQILQAKRDISVYFLSVCATPFRSGQSIVIGHCLGTKGNAGPEEQLGAT